MKNIMDESSINRTLVRMTQELIEKNKGTQDLILVGILTRGASLAQRMAVHIKAFEGVDLPVIALDIRPWRDDLKDQAFPKQTLPFDIRNKTIVLIDDVLYKGRTARAAINGIMSYGRPASIQLAVLVDRGHRELPIRADIVGKSVPTSEKETVKVLLKENDGVDAVNILETTQ